jgi:hypothetical protein
MTCGFVSPAKVPPLYDGRPLTSLAGGQSIEKAIPQPSGALISQVIIILIKDLRCC